jgi:DNA polymerase elongation subunit (family B)
MPSELDQVLQYSWLNGYDNWGGGGFTLVRRDEDGRRHFWECKNFPFYFYIKEAELDYAMAALREMKEEGILQRVTKAPGGWVKLYVLNNGKRDEENPRTYLHKTLTSVGVKTYEADLSNFERFCIDFDVKVATNHSVCYWDIETDDRQGWIDVGNQRVLSIGFIGSDGRRWWFCDDDERKVLQQAVAVMNEYDVVIGYNSAKFDWPVVRLRLQHFGLKRPMRCVVQLDLFKRLAKTVFKIGPAGGFVSKSWRLDDVGEAICGMKKIKHEQTIWEMFTSNRQLLKEYNMRDIEILKGIDENLTALSLMLKQTELTGRFLDGNITVGKLLDIYILKAGAKENAHFPSNMNWGSSEDQEQIVGGRVTDVNPGVYRNIHVYDFSAMYPSIIRTWNIGLDTYVADPPKDRSDDTLNYSPTGCAFRKEPQSMFSRIIVRLLEGRKKYKDAAEQVEYGSKEYRNLTISQTILKELANSAYGIFADRDSRYFMKDVAETITLGGQWLNRKMNEWFEAQGSTVAFSDTDSCAGTLPDGYDPEQTRHDFIRALTVPLKDEWNVDWNCFEVKYEKTFNVLVVVTKKQYVGHLVIGDGKPIDRIFVRGLETIKRDTIEITRRAETELFQIICKEKDWSLERLVPWMQALYEDVLYGEHPVEDYIIRKAVKANLESDYKGKLPDHVVVARQMINDKLEVFGGMDIQYVLIKNRSGGKPIAVPYYDPRAVTDWDRQEYWTKHVYAKLVRVLAVVQKEYRWDTFEHPVASEMGTYYQGVLV